MPSDRERLTDEERALEYWRDIERTIFTLYGDLYPDFAWTGPPEAIATIGSDLRAARARIEVLEAERLTMTNDEKHIYMLEAKVERLKAERGRYRVALEDVRECFERDNRMLTEIPLIIRRALDDRTEPRE